MHVQLYNSGSRSAGLPSFRHLPVVHSNATSLSQPRNLPVVHSNATSLSQPRNLTGLYLGLEGNTKPPRPKTGVPPLARSRGSSRMKTPIEEQRYNKVELMRAKEQKRGFSGYPVKKQPASSAQGDQVTAAFPSSHAPAHSPYPACSSATGHRGRPQSAAYSLLQHDGHSVQHDGHSVLYGPHDCQSRRWGPGKRIDPADIDTLLRPNPRKFTTISNSGVTRSERLDGRLWAASPCDVTTLGTAVDLGKVPTDYMAQLEQCTVYKGHVEVVYGSLPTRKYPPDRSDETGFIVRSYRNPKQADILAEFTTERDWKGGRPTTVPVRQPVVPQPYFFRHLFTRPGPLVAVMGHRQSGGASSVHGSSKILACPLAGSRTLARRPQPLAPTATPGHPLPHRHTTSPTPDADIDPDIQEVQGFSGHTTARIGIDLIGESDGGKESAEEEDRERAVGAAVAPPPSSSVAAARAHGGQNGLLVAAVPVTDSVVTESRYSTVVTPRPTPGTQAVIFHSASPRPDLEGPLEEQEQEQEPALATAEAVAQGEGEEEQGRAEVEQGEGEEEQGEGEGRAAMEAEIGRAVDNNNFDQAHIPVEFEVRVTEDEQDPSPTADSWPRPKLKASNSGADIMLGLETDDGESAEVEIDTADQDELMPEAEVPKGRVRKASITDKVIKTKASEAMAALIKEEAENRQRDFEKLLDEHAELVQEISRTPSSENLVQADRDH